MAALRQSAVGFVVVLVVAMAAAAVEGAGKNVDCTSLVVQKMADCLPFVTNATVDKPEGSCCSGLKTVLKNGPNCLCEVFKSSSQFGITVNVSKAASLPSACHVHAPSVTKCGVSVSPAGAPAVSPAGAPSSTANPPSASAGLTGLVPAAAPAEKGSSSTIRISVGLVLALIGGAIFSSF